MIRYLVIVVLLAACTPAVTPPPPDASDAAPLMPTNLTPDCNGMCSVLVSYGCSEGYGIDGGDSCVTTCTRIQGFFDMKPACIVNNSSSLAGVRSCGTVKCTGATGVRRTVR